jgi:GT2 family glycosyltransferase
MTPVAVAIISFNTREHLRACLTTVLAEEPREVIVLDNGSSDGSVEMVRRDFPQITLHVEPTNPGYGGAANRAIGGCSSEYVLLLNSDTLLQGGALRALSAYLDSHPRAGIVGPRLVNLDGTLQPSCFEFPTPLITLLHHTTLGSLIRYLPIIRDRYLGTWSHAYARTVPWLVGAALAIRREAFEEVGGFDESYFMYFEEVDLCYRLRAAGWETHYAPVTDVTHVGGASTLQSRADMRAQMFASALRFHERHRSRAGVFQATLVVQVIMLGRLVGDSARLLVTRDTLKRNAIAADLSAWRRVLYWSWRRQPTPEH